MAGNDLQGTLDLLVLKTLAQVPSLHGYGIVLHIQRASQEILQVEEGSLYPALHRMEVSGWVPAFHRAAEPCDGAVAGCWVPQVSLLRPGRPQN